MVLVFTRSIVETTLLRAPGALYQQTAEGNLENIYTLKLVNKTSRDIPVQLKLESPAGNLLPEMLLIGTLARRRRT